ncbi:MAG TPA: stage II sporulation protein M, partial [Candidatus Methanoperedens sp.]
MQKDLEYLYSLRKYILVITVVFIISIIIGLIEADRNPGFSQKYFESYRNLFEWIRALNPFQLVILIFANNAIKSLLVLLMGVGIGIVPLFFIAVNGFSIGIMADVVSREQGILFVI